MSEDKIMDIIKGKLLMIDKMLKQDQEEGHGSAYEMQNEDFEAIQGLLDLYTKEKEKNEEYENKIKSVLELIDTKPYTAYTLYGDILYDDENIRELLEERN